MPLQERLGAGRARSTEARVDARVKAAVRPRGKQQLFTALSLFCLAFMSLPLASAQAPEPPAIVVHADQVEGRVSPFSLTNASYGAIYGLTTSPLADPALAWVRASNSLSYVRCYNWLGDGIPKGHPEWFSGCRVARSGPPPWQTVCMEGRPA